MQEEVNEKTISLCIKGGKITAKILKAALIKLLAEMDKKKKQQEKGKGQCKRTGKQSIDSVCVCLFLDAFASHRWRDHRFLVGVIVQTILMYAGHNLLKNSSRI